MDDVPEISRLAFEQYHRPSTSVPFSTTTTTTATLFSTTEHDGASHSITTSLHATSAFRKQLSESSLNKKVDPMDILSGKVKPTLTSPKKRFDFSDSDDSDDDGGDSRSKKTSSSEDGGGFQFTFLKSLKKENNTSDSLSSNNHTEISPQKQQRAKFKNSPSKSVGSTPRVNPTAQRRLPIQSFSSETYKPPRSTTKYGGRRRRSSLNGKTNPLNASTSSNKEGSDEDEDEDGEFAALGITNRFKSRVGNTKPLKLPSLDKERTLMFGTQKAEEKRDKFQQQQRFQERNQAVMHARKLKSTKTYAGHRKPQKYIMVGSRATLSNRQDMSEEELLELERLQLVAAPELFYGKGISASNNQVRRRDLERGRSRNASVAEFTKRKKRSTIQGVLEEEGQEGDIIEESIISGDEEQVEETDVEPPKPPTSAQLDLRMDHTLHEAEHILTGWEGTALDRPTGSLLSDDEDDGDGDGETDDKPETIEITEEEGLTEAESITDGGDDAEPPEGEEGNAEVLEEEPLSTTIETIAEENDADDDDGDDGGDDEEEEEIAEEEVVEENVEDDDDGEDDDGEDEEGEEEDEES